MPDQHQRGIRKIICHCNMMVEEPRRQCKCRSARRHKRIQDCVERAELSILRASVTHRLSPPAQLVRRNVLDVGTQRPGMTKWISKSSRAITVKLVLHWPHYL